MEPILIATDSERVDVCAVQDFELDMAIGYDRQDFTATFSPIGGVGGGSLLYIDGTEYGGVVDDVTSDTETGLIQCHGRTWDGILACKRILPPDGSAYRTVSGDANSVLAELVALLDISDVFSASSETSGITVSYQFDRFVDAYEGITKMLASASAKLTMRRVSGKTVLGAEPSSTIEDEVDSDLMDFTVTSQTRTVNHLVCAGMGEGTEREVIHLYADGNGNVSQTQTFTGIDEITAFYDYNNAEGDELLTSGIEKLQEYQTQGSVEVTGVGTGEWGIGDVLVARDNASGTAVASPIVGKTVKVGPQTNWTLAVEYAVGEATRVKAEAIGRGENAYVIGGVSGVKGDAESAYRTGDVNLTPADIGVPMITKVAANSYSVNSGYFTLTNSAISSSSIVVAQPYYTTRFVNKYHYTIQNSSGVANVYVRDYNGSAPANGTRVGLAFIIVN